MKPKFKVGDEVIILPKSAVINGDDVGDKLIITSIQRGTNKIAYFTQNKSKKLEDRSLYFENELALYQEYVNEQAMKKLLGVD